MGAVFNATGRAHSAIVAPEIHAFTAKAAYRTKIIIHITVAAFRTVAFVLDRTAVMHMAVVAPSVSTICTISAALTRFISTFIKAVSTFATRCIVFNVADQASILTSGITLTAAIKATMADHTSCIYRTLAAVRAVSARFNPTGIARITIGAPVIHTIDAKTAFRAVITFCKTDTAFRTVISCIYSTIEAHMTGIAPLGISLTRTALLAVMLITAVSISGCAVTASVADIVIPNVFTAETTVLAIVIVCIYPHRQYSCHHQERNKNTQHFCFHSIHNCYPPYLSHSSHDAVGCTYPGKFIRTGKSVKDLFPAHSAV